MRVIGHTENGDLILEVAPQFIDLLGALAENTAAIVAALGKPAAPAPARVAAPAAAPGPGSVPPPPPKPPRKQSSRTKTNLALAARGFNMVCAECKKPFVAKNRTTRICSDECRIKRNSRRSLEQYHAKRKAAAAASPVTPHASRPPARAAATPAGATLTKEQRLELIRQADRRVVSRGPSSLGRDGSPSRPSPSPSSVNPSAEGKE